MTSVLTLILLAGMPIVVCSVAWWYQFGRGDPTDAQHQARNGDAGPTMPRVLAESERARVIRWVEDSRAIFERVGRVLDELEELKTAAKDVEKVRAQLQQTRAALRAEVRRLHAESERLQSERAESTRWCAAMMRDAAVRLRIELPST